MRIQTLQYAEKWLNLNEVETVLDKQRETLSIVVNDFYFDLSDSEIEYRAELYLDSEKEAIKH